MKYIKAAFLPTAFLSLHSILQRSIFLRFKVYGHHTNDKISYFCPDPDLALKYTEFVLLLNIMKYWLKIIKLIIRIRSQTSGSTALVKPSIYQDTFLLCPMFTNCACKFLNMFHLFAIFIFLAKPQLFFS
jgi:hypothetical protein